MAKADRGLPVCELTGDTSSGCAKSSEFRKNQRIHPGNPDVRIDACGIPSYCRLTGLGDDRRQLAKKPASGYPDFFGTISADSTLQGALAAVADLTEILGFEVNV